MTYFLSASEPYPIKLNGGNDRRLRVPMIVLNADRFHWFLGLRVPVGAYIDEINICLRSAKVLNFPNGERVIRKTVEGTLRLKFKQGNRGFRQWLLKHESWTRLATNRKSNLGKNNSGKVKEPTINLNPAMEVGFSKGNRFAIGRVSKRNKLRYA